MSSALQFGILPYTGPASQPRCEPQGLPGDEKFRTCHLSNSETDFTHALMFGTLQKSHMVYSFIITFTIF